MKRTIKEVNTDAFNLSISDLMAGLLAIFIFILCYYILTFNAIKKDYEGNNQLRQEMLVELKENLKKEDIIVEIEEDKGVLHLPEGSVFFRTSDDRSNADGERVIRKLAGAIRETITNEKYREKIGTIFIEGHTDDVRQWGIASEKEFDAYNWGLSTRRAIYTWEIMSQAEEELISFTNKDGDYVFSCSGYGPTRPRDLRYKSAEASADVIRESRKANRRIDIRFTMILPKDDKNLGKSVKEQMVNE